ncbi:MAG: hypothetical protein ACPG4Y_08950 [Chitinophagales bacterium]
MFLKTCYKKSLPIFSFFIGFILILAFLNYKVIQIHPFQIWGMFSRPISEKEIVECYVISINNKTPSFYTMQHIPKVSYINPTISKYIQLKHGEDPFKYSSLQINNKYNLGIENIINDVFVKRNSIKKYPSWLYNYMQQFQEEEIYNYEVNKVSLRFDSAGKVKKVDEQLILNYNNK